MTGFFKEVETRQNIPNLFLNIMKGFFKKYSAQQQHFFAKFQGARMCNISPLITPSAVNIET